MSLVSNGFDFLKLIMKMHLDSGENSIYIVKIFRYSSRQPDKSLAGRIMIDLEIRFAFNYG
jgi:hypothetical protein